MRNGFDNVCTGLSARSDNRVKIRRRVGSAKAPKADVICL
jgi:hypothetical protein